MQSRRAVLDLQGGTCTSCSIAIEHAGRRIKGIEQIFVDRGTNTIQVEFTGDTSVLDDIKTIVERIGYEATVRTVDPE